MTLWFFQLQQQEGLDDWADVPPVRYVQLKPRRNSGESDPVAAWAIRHMKAKSGGPFRVKIREFEDGIYRRTFVVHSDGSRTAIQDATATADTSQREVR